ncbi:MAG: ABC transporter substrate-binding protein [Candidatus Aenigmatarchaeota archaeon]
MNKFLIAAMCILIVVGFSGCTQTGVNSGGSALKLKEPGKLIIGTNLPYEPMEFYDASENIVGIDADVAREIAAQLGLEPEIRNVDWDLLFEQVKSGDLDIIISSISITSERQREYLFSTPYFNAGQVVITRKDNTDIKFPEDLKNKKVSAQKDTTSAEEAAKYSNSSTVYENSDYEKTVADIKNGNLDAIVMDYVAGIMLVKNDQSLKIAVEPFTQEFYGIATKLDNTALIDEVNRVLRGMKSTGKLEEVKNKWLG